MEPIHPSVREELKRVHPGLTDADIDRYEELTSLRFTLDPSAEAEEIRNIDNQRTRLIQTKMPRLAELENAFAARAAQASRRVKPPPRIEVKPPRQAD